MNPFDLKNGLNRIKDFINPFKQQDKEEKLKEKQRLQNTLDQLTELLEASESLDADPRYSQIRKIKEELLNQQVDLLKNQITTDPKIASIQAVIHTLDEQINLTKEIKKQIERLSNAE